VAANDDSAINSNTPNFLMKSPEWRERNVTQRAHPVRHHLARMSRRITLLLMVCVSVAVPAAMDAPDTLIAWHRDDLLLSTDAGCSAWRKWSRDSIVSVPLCASVPLW
jgi:hypothetical protein